MKHQNLYFLWDETEGADAGGVETLAAHLGIGVISSADQVPAGSLFLKQSDRGLLLTDTRRELLGDFTRMLPRLRSDNLSKELLVRAAKGKRAAVGGTAIDATAGLGEDALLLAAAGFCVQLFESDPVIAALLEDALRRARTVPHLDEIVARMHLTEGDSISAMERMRESPEVASAEVILLDPMFPERKKSALVKKKFQLLQQLEQPCSDETALFAAASGLHPKRLIVKRPAKGPYLDGKKPDYSLAGKSIRYDCFTSLAKQKG